MTIETRLTRHPQMRASTLAYLQKRDATTAQLQREIRAKAEADARGPNPILIIAGKLKVLAARLVN